MTATFDDYARARWPRLVRAVRLLGVDHHAAEDAVQTALAQCYLRWARVSRADDVDAYVHRVLLNTVHRARRRRWTGEHPTERLPETGVLDGLGGLDGTGRRDDADALLAALRRLPAPQRETVVLRYYCDLSEAQTAAALGLAPGTVKSRCARALAALAADPDLDECREAR